MRILHFKVSAQVLEPVGDFSNLVPGTEGYLHADFEFSDEWSDCTKIASFFDRKGHEYAQHIINNRCPIPNEVLVDPIFKVKVTMANQRLRASTNTIIIKQQG